MRVPQELHRVGLEPTTKRLRAAWEDFLLSFVPASYTSRKTGSNIHGNITHVPNGRRQRGQQSHRGRRVHRRLRRWSPAISVR